MAHGGKRQGAGRRTGALAERTRKIAEAATQDGLTPLEYLLSVMRDESLDVAGRMEAAKAAAPYVHPRLANVEMNAKHTVTHEDWLDELAKQA